MESITITGGARLRGSVRVGGAKNAALPILAATILVPGEHRVRNVPVLRDVATMSRLLETLGAQVERRGDELVVRTGTLSGEEEGKLIFRAVRQRYPGGSGRGPSDASAPPAS